MTEASDHKRNLMRERDYLSERLPEVMMERQRLKMWLAHAMAEIDTIAV